MKNVLRIIKRDFKGLIKNPIAMLLIAAILLLPALYAWLNIYASWDPYQNMDGIQVAIYTEDEDYMLDDGTKVNMSEDMMSQLFKESSLTWKVVGSRDEAVEGVYDGTYYASVVIESDFTKSMFDFDNIGENEPTITFYQNQKKNAIATRMTDSACNVLKRCLSESYIRALMMEVFGHFNGLDDDIADVKSDVDNSQNAFQNLRHNLKNYESTINSFINADKLLVKTVDETDKLVDAAVSSLYDSAENMDRQSGVIKQIQADLKKDTEKATDSIGTLQTHIDDLSDITARIGELDTVDNLSEMISDTRDTLVETKDLLKDLQKVVDAAESLDENADTMGFALCDSVDYLLDQTEKLLDYVDARYDDMITFSENLRSVLNSAVTYNDVAAANYEFLVNNAGYTAGSTDTYITAILLAANGYNLEEIYRQGYAAGGEAGGAQAVKAALQGAAAMTEGKTDSELLMMALQAIASDSGLANDDPAVMEKVNELMNSASSIFASIDRMQQRAEEIKAQYESIQDQLPDVVKNAGAALKDAGLKYVDDTVRTIQASVNQTLLDTIAKLNQLENIGGGDSSAVKADIIAAKAKIAEARTEVAAIRTAFKDFEINAPDVDADDAIKVINQLLGDLEEVQDALDSAQRLVDTTGEGTEALAQVNRLAGSTSEFINSTVWPQVNSTLNDMEEVMDEISSLLIHATGTMKDGKKVLGNVSLTMMGANNSLSSVKEVLDMLNGRISPIIDDIEDMQDAEIIADLRALLGLDPDAVSDYFASPVDTYTDSIYSIENYGSGMAPFYTSLAIWIGSIILGALFKTQADRRGLRKPKTWQLFAGRYFLFFVVAQLQAFVILLGNLLLLNIQCEHPILFLLTGSLVAFTFSILIYSLILCFGILGKAIAILLFILQIACSGGTYPVELLPTQFSVLQKFLPFDYSISAMRSCIAGVYQHDVAWCYAVMLLLIGGSIVLGLRSKLFRGFTDYMEEQMEESHLTE